MKVLVVIDMQNDFIDGVLGTKEASNIIISVKEKIKKYLESGNKVIFTQDTHNQNYLKTQEGKNLPIPHCIKGTNGWEISKKIYVVGCPVIEKPSFGSFELAEEISNIQDLESIELIGVCTDICVISNAIILKTKMPEIPVFIDKSCCAGTTIQNHENALNVMKMCQIEII